MIAAWIATLRHLTVLLMIASPGDFQLYLASGRSNDGNCFGDRISELSG